MLIHGSRQLPALTGSAKAVLRRLVAEGPSTRPQIGSALGLSRPTMSAAIAELERPGYVEEMGAHRGRSAVAPFSTASDGRPDM
ncbi:helix-turn-helix domain-containing protein [Mesorhizobium sp. J428]|uniref:MarR family transcriptional regulator n=1 Tax=Mesorhizobium sp. J428 TaxID=2898440 RepID=UPI002151E20C|nr:helix-turn-helix domain-containing protein [Mesorhizobium sp. J428]MCR5857220.1 MarR family transcriptional regulator [Mesorhizobium sp. J428]